MIQTKEIREAMLRLSIIERKPHQYDSTGEIFGDGPIHYLIEVASMFFIAWENDCTGSIVVNLITRFSLDELEELGSLESWTILRVPATVAERIQFCELDHAGLREAYHHMQKRSTAASGFPVARVAP